MIVDWYNTIFITGLYFAIGVILAHLISKFVVLLYPNSTVGAYRKVFLHFVYVLSIFYGLIITNSMRNLSHILQEYVLIGGGVVLFVGAFFFKEIRRHSILFPLGFGVIIFIWSILSPWKV